MKHRLNQDVERQCGGFSVIEAAVALSVLAGIVVLAFAWMTGNGAAA